MLVIHGVPLSQPFRSVLWPCLIKHLAFTLQLAVPGSGGKYATKRPEFRSKFPLGTIPSIEDDGIYLSEAPAILAYLSVRHGWGDVYPQDMKQRARVDEYCHWHHSNLRSLTRAYFRNFTVPHPLITAEVIALYKKQAENALKVLENAYLTPSGGGFLLGTSHPTAADFMAYEEVAQVSPDFGSLHNLETYPNIRSWLGKMAALPYHDEVHSALSALGDLTIDIPPISERLGHATKAGLKAIADAQKRIIASPSQNAHSHGAVSKL